jgi:glycosyltransferase involved in cell wall biosynthesis
MTDAFRPRVLIVNPWPSFWSMGGGAGCSDEYETLRGFVGAGYDVHYVLPEGGPDPQSDPLTARASFTYIENVFARGHLLPAPLKRLYWYTRFARASRRAACDVARARAPHVVFAYTPYAVPAARGAAAATNGAPAASVTKLFGVRDLVVSGRARVLDWYTNTEAIHAFRAPTTRLIVLDDGTRGDVAAARYGVTAPRLLFWPNGVNTEWGAQPPARSREEVLGRHGIDPRAGVVLSLSRLVPYKRVDRVIAAVPELLQLRAGAPTAVLIAGEGPTRAALEEQASQRGIAGAVRFIGPVAHDDVPNYLGAADVFVATSEMTNAGIPTCEALVMGVPVVAARTGATADLVIDGEAGFLVEPDDAPALAARLASILADPPLRARLSAGARRVAATRCVSWSKRVGWEVALVRELAEQVERARR